MKLPDLRNLRLQNFRVDLGVVMIWGAVLQITGDGRTTSSPEMQRMNIRVKLFAIVRERAGAAEVVVDLPHGATAAAAGEAVFERFPAVRQVARSVAYAVNRSYVPPTTALQDGDEVALIPPVSGG